MYSSFCFLSYRLYSLPESLTFLLMLISYKIWYYSWREAPYIIGTSGFTKQVAVPRGSHGLYMLFSIPNGSRHLETSVFTRKGKDLAICEDLKETPEGHLDGWVIERLLLAQVMILGSWDGVLQELPAGSLLIPLPVSLPLSVCLLWINKIFKKQTKNPQKIWKEKLKLKSWLSEDCGSLTQWHTYTEVLSDL